MKTSYVEMRVDVEHEDVWDEEDVADAVEALLRRCELPRIGDLQAGFVVDVRIDEVGEL